MSQQSHGNEEPDIYSISLLALALYRSHCFEAVVKICSDLPYTSDLRIPVALRVLSAKSKGKINEADPEAVRSAFQSQLSPSNQLTADQLLETILSEAGKVVESQGEMPVANATQSLHVSEPSTAESRWAHLPPPPEGTPHSSQSITIEELHAGSLRPRRPSLRILGAVTLAIAAATTSLAIWSSSAKNPSATLSATQTTIHQTTTTRTPTTVLRTTTTARPATTTTRPATTTTRPPTTTRPSTTGSWFTPGATLTADSRNRDFYFTIQTTRIFRAETYSDDNDPYLWLYDNSGALIASDDDGAGFGLDSLISIRLTPGTYRLRAGVCCEGPTAWYGPFYLIETS